MKNSIKDKTHTSKPQLEVSDNLTVDVEYMTELLFDISEYADEYLYKEKDDEKKFTKEDLFETYEHLNKIYGMLVTNEKQYKALLLEVEYLNLEDRQFLLEALLSTARFEDLDKKEETAEKAEDFRK